MAPVVGLEMGHSFPADVHSFGILLWQICALKKPFDKVESADQFHEVVFVNGTRPKLVKYILATSFERHNDELLVCICGR